MGRWGWALRLSRLSLPLSTIAYVAAYVTGAWDEIGPYERRFLSISGPIFVASFYALSYVMATVRRVEDDPAGYCDVPLSDVAFGEDWEDEEDGRDLRIRLRPPTPPSTETADMGEEEEGDGVGEGGGGNGGGGRQRHVLNSNGSPCVLRARIWLSEH